MYTIMHRKSNRGRVWKGEEEEGEEEDVGEEVGEGGPKRK